MSQIKTSTLPCPACGAENNPFASECWICHQAMGPDEPVWGELIEAEAIAPQRRTAETLGLIAFCLVIVTLTVVGIGLTTIGVGVSAVYVLGITPALLGLSFAAWRGAGSQSSVVSTLSVIASSLVLAILVPILLLVAVVVALAIFCISLL